MKQIKLENCELFAEVDDEDFERIRQYKWYANSIRNIIHRNNHVPRQGIYGTHKNARVSLAAEVMQNHGKMYDHINRNFLTNTKENLRPCNHVQNGGNRRKQRGTSSHYKGVCWNKTVKKWIAYVKSGKKILHLGYFEYEIAAALAYDRKARIVFGEFVNPNFPALTKGYICV